MSDDGTAQYRAAVAVWGETHTANRRRLTGTGASATPPAPRSSQPTSPRPTPERTRIMQNPPTKPKTTCPEHRRQGYAFVAGLMVCRGCGLPAGHHETIDETMARRATSERARS